MSLSCPGRDGPSGWGQGSLSFSAYAAAPLIQNPDQGKKMKGWIDGMENARFYDLAQSSSDIL